MRRSLWVAVYAIAMAAVESSVVVYLRALHGGAEALSVLQYQLPTPFLTIEVGREAATLVMLIAVAAIAARNAWEGFLYFALAFGLWDIFYYIWLWVFIGWPPSLFTWDVLFLIPVPWLGPVLAPVIVSLCLVAGALRLLSRSVPRLSRRAWVLATVGAVLVLLSFTIDYHYALMRTEPPRFRWELFLPGIVIGVVGVVWDRGLRPPVRASVLFLLCVASPAAAQTRDSTWAAYGGDAGGTRFSPLAQIDAVNVKSLRLAWIARTGDYLTDRGRFEATPILVDGTLFVSTPLGSVLALDPATGAERWKFAGPVRFGYDDYGDFANRGVAAWTAGRAGASCALRIFVATVNARLIALDGHTGRPCDDFGDHGTVDLTKGLRHHPEYDWEYGVTSPPTVVGNVVIVGSSISDNHRTDAPEGAVRAFDVRSGAQRWRFDPIPLRKSDSGYAGAANAWSVFSADPARDMVFIPIGSASPDFYGGARLGDNRFANSVVALQASTGKLIWAFQVVHHDIWDYDVPAQPTLFTLRRGGRAIPAVAVGTKMGHLFILDRRNGKPLIPVEELPVPPSDVPGEVASPTQPFPPPAFRLAPESLSATEAYGVTDSMRARCRARIAALRFRGVFTPPSLQGTIIWPGNIGGMNWSGVSVDERRGILVAPTNQLATVVRLIPRDSLHAAIMAQPDLEYGRQRGTPYGMSRDDLRICTPPPWGALTALDLNSGTVKWRVPLGFFPPLAQAPGAAGSAQLGGALLTGSGLVFIAGTFDQHLRAIDIGTGAELWSASLPAAGHALPMSYSVGGRQYVVIAAGGHDRLHTRTGDYVLAYTLPGPGAPTPDTTPGPLSGTWEGEMHIGDARFGMGLTLAVAGDSVNATVRLDSVLVGPVTAQRSGRGVTVSFPLYYAGKGGCSATLRTTVELWNGGRLLEGGGTFDGACASNGHQEAAFVFRRASVAPSPP